MVFVIPLVAYLDPVFAVVRDAGVLVYPGDHRRVVGHGLLRRGFVFLPRRKRQLRVEAHLHVVAPQALRRFSADAHRQLLTCDRRSHSHRRTGLAHRAARRMVVRFAQVSHRRVAIEHQSILQRIRDLDLVRILRDVSHQVVGVGLVKRRQIVVHVLFDVLLDLRLLLHRVGDGVILRTRRLGDARLVLRRHPGNAGLDDAVCHAGQHRQLLERPGSMIGIQRQALAFHGHRFAGAGPLHQLDRHGRVLRPVKGRALAVLPDLLHADVHRRRRHRHRVAIVVILPVVPDLDLVLAGVRNALVARRAALHRRVLRHFLRRSGILRPRVDVQLCAEAHLHIVPAHCLRRFAGDTHRQRLACNARRRRHCRAGVGHRAVHRVVVRRAKVNHRHAIADKLHRAVQRVRDLYLVRVLRHIRHQLILIARVECSKLCMHVLIYILLDLRRLAQRVRHRIGHRASLRIRHVRDRRAVILRHARHARLRHAVDDRLAVRVLRKRLELPAGGFRVQGQRLLSHSRPVAVRLLHKLDRHDGIFRPRERPAPGVLPDLLDLDLRLLRCMGVRQRRDCAFGAVARQRIAVRYTVLRPGVGDRLAITLQRQVVDRRRPFVRRVQRHGPNHRLAVLQLHAQARRAHAVLVVVVVPDLPDCRGGLSGRVAVRQRRDCAVHAGFRQRITLRQAALGPGVADFRAVCILRQAGDRRAPAVRLVQRHFLTVRQCHRQACRTLAVLVIVVVPDLLDRRFCRLRRMLVRQRRDRAFGAVARQRIAGGFIVLSPGIDDLYAACILRQIGNRLCPIVLRVQRHGLDLRRTVHQLHAQARWTLAVLVIVVVPDLLDRRFCRLRGKGVRHRQAVLPVILNRVNGQSPGACVFGHRDDRILRRAVVGDSVQYEAAGGLLFSRRVLPGHAAGVLRAVRNGLGDGIVIGTFFSIGDVAERRLCAVLRGLGFREGRSGHRSGIVGRGRRHRALALERELEILVAGIRIAGDALSHLQVTGNPGQVVRELDNHRLIAGVIGGHGGLDRVLHRHGTVLEINLLDPIFRGGQGYSIACRLCAVLPDGHGEGNVLFAIVIGLLAFFIGEDTEGIGALQLALGILGQRGAAIVGDGLFDLQGAGLLLNLVRDDIGILVISILFNRKGFLFGCLAVDQGLDDLVFDINVVSVGIAHVHRSLERQTVERTLPIDRLVKGDCLRGALPFLGICVLSINLVRPFAIANLLLQFNGDTGGLTHLFGDILA